MSWQADHIKPLVEQKGVLEEDLVKEGLLKIKGDLESIDLDTITPLDALNILFRLKNNI